MKPKILLLSDAQFHNYKTHCTLIEGVNSRLLDIERAWRDAVTQGAKAGCNLCLFGGDMFEVRGQLRPSVFNRVFNLIQWTAGLMPVAMIAGNHDMENYRGGDTAIDAFDSINDVSVLNAPYESDFRHSGYRLFGIPYVHDIAEFKAIYEEVCTKRPCIILMHQGIDDFDMTGHIPETGVTVKYLSEHKPENCWIFSGHYHSPKQDGRVVMIGAPVQHRADDEGGLRGYMIFDGKEVEHNYLSGIPEFVTITGKAQVPAAKGNFVRVQAKRLADANRLADAVWKAGALSVVCRVEKEFTTAHEKTIKISGDTRMMLSEYLTITGKYADKKDAILRKFEEICL